MEPIDKKEKEYKDNRKTNANLKITITNFHYILFFWGPLD
jgi:hypothetical protein